MPERDPETVPAATRRTMLANRAAAAGALALGGSAAAAREPAAPAVQDTADRTIVTGGIEFR